MPRGFPDWSKYVVLWKQVNPMLTFIEWAAKNRADRMAEVHISNPGGTTRYATLFTCPEGYACYLDKLWFYVSFVDGRCTSGFKLQPDDVHILHAVYDTYVYRSISFRVPFAMTSGQYIEVYAYAPSGGAVEVTFCARFWIEEL